MISFYFWGFTCLLHTNRFVLQLFWFVATAAWLVLSQLYWKTALNNRNIALLKRFQRDVSTHEALRNYNVGSYGSKAFALIVESFTMYHFVTENLHKHTSWVLFYIWKLTTLNVLFVLFFAVEKVMSIVKSWYMATGIYFQNSFIRL